MDCVSNVKDFSLPGKQAHLRTMPKERKKQLENLSKEHPNAKYAAVLIYCYPKNGIMHMSLIKRTTYKGPHSGQISLPGGKPEAVDKSLWHTALRECKEELGVSLLGSKPLLNLSPIYIPPSNFLVSPFIVVDPSSPVFAPDPREVAQHIEIPLSELIQLKVKQSLLYEALPRNRGPQARLPSQSTWICRSVLSTQVNTIIQQTATALPASSAPMRAQHLA